MLQKEPPETTRDRTYFLVRTTAPFYRSDTTAKIVLPDTDQAIGEAPLQTETLIPLEQQVVEELAGCAAQLRIDSAELGRLYDQLVVLPAIGELSRADVDLGAVEPIERVQPRPGGPTPREIAELEEARQVVPGHRVRELGRMIRGITGSEVPRVPGWVNEYIRDLNLAGDLARLLLTEEDFGAGQELKALLRSQPGQRPGDAFMRPLSYGPGGGDATPNGSAFCFADPTNSFMIAQSGLLLDMAEESGDKWSDRAREFVHRRAGPLNSLMCRVVDVDCRRVGPGSWERLMQGEGIATGGGEPLSVPENPHGIPDRRHRGCCGGRPGGAGGFGAGGQDGDGDSDGLGIGPCEALWIDCMKRYQEIGSAVSQATPTTKAIGAVSPDALCVSDLPARITIRAQHGHGFGARSAAGSTLMYASGAQLISPTIVNWTPDEITVELPASAHSGYFFFDRGIRVGADDLGACHTLFGLGTPPSLGWIASIQDRRWAEANKANGYGYVELVPQPRVARFVAGKNAQQTVTAEACTEVRIEWEVDFGGGPSADVDEESLDRVEVEIADANRTLFTGLARSGTKMIDHADSRTLTLTARATVDSKSCGEDQAQVEVNRYHRLYLTPGGTSIDVEKSAQFTLRRSCATSTPVSVALRDTGNRLSFDSPVTIPADQDRVQFTAEVTGAACGVTTLKALASGHVEASARVEIHGEPTISNVRPASFRMADKPDIHVETTCAHQDPHTVRIFKDSLTETLSVEQVSGTTLRCGGKLLEPGKWDLQVTSNGWKSNILSEALHVRPSRPQIDRFWIDGVANGAIVWCVNTQVKLCWEVRFAKEIVLKRRFQGRETVVCRTPNSDPLKVMQDCCTDSVDKAVSYVLEVHPFGGGRPEVTQPITPAVNSTFKVVTDLVVNNRGSSEEAHIWARDARNVSQSVKLGVVAAGKVHTFALPTCQHFDTVVSVRDSLVDDYNDHPWTSEELDVDDPKVVQYPSTHSGDLNNSVVAHPEVSRTTRLWA